MNGGPGTAAKLHFYWPGTADYQNQLVSAVTTELRAEATYNQAPANFQLTTATTLLMNNVIVGPPVKTKN